MKPITHRKLARCQRRIRDRLAHRHWKDQPHPMLRTRHIRYELSDRDRAITCGGLGVIHLLAHQVGLPQAIDRNVHMLKRHVPYFESDHVLSLAYNILADGGCIEDLELLRTNEAVLDALGAQRLPDPTTAGDFCRRFKTDDDILLLQETINEVRLNVWKQQDPSFFKQAILDVDGTLAPTYGECKEGMDISYDGQWGYHPLLISLANTHEPLYLVNRPGNRPSHEQADDYLDKSIALCRRAGFESIRLGGDTDFMQTWKLDEWDQTGYVTFVFGADAGKTLIGKAEALPQTAWRRLERPARYEVQTQERAKPENVKERVVRERGYKNFILQWEDVAEFDYQPHLCRQSYRMVVLRKKIAVERGMERLFEEYRYFFYITNVRVGTAEEIVFQSNDRCNQENLIEQLKNGVQAMRNPLDNLHSNWAYMVMSSLAWTLKAWCGLSLPVTPGRWESHHRQQRHMILHMEFKRFRNMMLRIPCQIVKTGRRIIYRIMSWNPWTSSLLRLAEATYYPMRC